MKRDDIINKEDFNKVKWLAYYIDYENRYVITDLTIKTYADTGIFYEKYKYLFVDEKCECCGKKLYVFNKDFVPDLKLIWDKAKWD